MDNPQTAKRKDLFLAQRRNSVIFPFAVIAFIFSLFMLIYSGMSESAALSIRDEYKLDEKKLKYKKHIKEDKKVFCQAIMDKIKENKNFTEVFNITDGLSSDVGVCLGFSITILIMNIILLLCTLCCGVSVFKSAEEIRKNNGHSPIGKHSPSYCLSILKIGMSAFSLLLIFSTLAGTNNFNISEYLENVYDFEDDCINDDDFEDDFELCWSIKKKIKGYLVFAIFYMIFDIASLVLLFFTKKRNIWSFLLNKASLGKFKYEEIDSSEGQNIPFEEEAHQDNIIEEENKKIEDNNITPKNEDERLLDNNIIDDEHDEHNINNSVAPGSINDIENDNDKANNNEIKQDDNENIEE